MTRLGKYLFSISANKADIYYKTGIDESRLSLLSSDANTLLYADEFYLIAKAENQDITNMSNEVFKDFALNEMSQFEEKEGITEFGKYVSKFVNTQKNIAERINIPDSRFSKLVNDKNKRPYASEVYLLAKLTDKTPGYLFELFYSHLKLNSKEIQDKLRKAAKDKRSIGKK